jgi:hypothetical protein
MYTETNQNYNKGLRESGIVKYLLSLITLFLLAVLLPSSGSPSYSEEYSGRQPIEAVNKIDSNSIFIRCPALAETPLTTGKPPCLIDRSILPR